MTRKFSVLIATAGSALLLAGAWTFQALGYLPCAMCYWQRWPHMAAVAIGIAALLIGVRSGAGRTLAWLGAVAAAITSGIGMFHAGVEKKWWPGPSSCTGSGQDLGTLSGADLLATDSAPRLIMCDQVSWEMLGLSMAGWNALFSLILVGVWVYAATRRT
ncbi:MAG: disulfide bond formation protein B [Celeribacter sp.]|jgi:disulfide bond formation protein DsbB